MSSHPFRPTLPLPDLDNLLRELYRYILPLDVDPVQVSQKQQLLALLNYLLGEDRAHPAGTKKVIGKTQVPKTQSSSASSSSLAHATHYRQAMLSYLGYAQQCVEFYRLFHSGTNHTSHIQPLWYRMYLGTRGPLLIHWNYALHLSSPPIDPSSNSPRPVVNHEDPLLAPQRPVSVQALVAAIYGSAAFHVRNGLYPRGPAASVGDCAEDLRLGFLWQRLAQSHLSGKENVAAIGKGSSRTSNQLSRFLPDPALCADQYLRMLRCCRVPYRHMDSLVVSHTQDVLVCCGGRLFIVQWPSIPYPDGPNMSSTSLNHGDFVVPAHPDWNHVIHRVARQLQHILDIVEQGGRAMGPEKLSMTQEGIPLLIPTSALCTLTNGDRDQWAACFEILWNSNAHNKQLLHRIVHCAFSICLDVPHWIQSDEPFSTVNGDVVARREESSKEEEMSAAPGLSTGHSPSGLSSKAASTPLRRRAYDVELFGGLHGHAIRYADMGISIVVCPDGVGALSMEHSWGDGSALQLLAAYLFEWRKGKIHLLSSPVVVEASTRAELLFHEIVLDLNSGLDDGQRQWMHAAIHQAALLHESTARNLSLVAVEVNGVGASAIKQCHMSPDAFVHSAFHLSQRVCFGDIRSTYASLMMKAYHHGRTETLRTVTAEVQEAASIIQRNAWKLMLRSTHAQQNSRRSSAARFNGQELIVCPPLPSQLQGTEESRLPAVEHNQQKSTVINESHVLETIQTSLLRNLAERCSAAHTSRITRCREGLGVHRHLMALSFVHRLLRRDVLQGLTDQWRSIADGYAPQHEPVQATPLRSIVQAEMYLDKHLFLNPVLTEALCTDFLSTSAIASYGIEYFSFGPVAAPGLGIGYSPFPDKLRCVVTSFKDCPRRPAQKIPAPFLSLVTQQTAPIDRLSRTVAEGPPRFVSIPSNQPAAVSFSVVLVHAILIMHHILKDVEDVERKKNSAPRISSL